MGTSKMDPVEADERVNKVKSLMLKNWKTPIGLAQRQKAGSGFFPVKGDQTWTSQVSLVTPPEHALRQRFLQGIQELDVSHSQFTVNPSSHIKGEWVGHRPASQGPAPSSVHDETERYFHLQSATNSSVTVLYIHGGGFVMGSPSHSRKGFTARIAALTGGKCFALDYRLSPQTIFPAALYDALIAYLSLQYPPKDACHDSIPASSIVLAGDSAGANLCMTLTKLILQLRKASNTIPFNGKDVSLELPAGVSILSGYVDVTECMPSITNTPFDYWQDPKLENASDHPHDKLWPSKPARESPYCEDVHLCHPLINPMCNSDWTGAPPMWISMGEEIIRDSCKIIAQRAKSQGVVVHLRQYDHVPHVFHLLPGLENLPQTVQCMADLAVFYKTCVEGPQSLVSEAYRMKFPSFQVETCSVEDCFDTSFEEARQRALDRAEMFRKKYIEINRKAELGSSKL